MQGSFVYAFDNSPAGPNKVRSECFPKATERATWWTEGKWNGTFACLRCLPSYWNCSYKEVCDWLYMQHTGARDSVRIAKKRSSAQSSSWRPSYQGQRGDGRRQRYPE